MYLLVKSRAVEEGVAGLRLYVETGNARAKKTYEALGMSSEHYSFYEWMRK
jgi:ribosomal protein S18 acetylase RimI-like enzyme